MKIIRVQEPCGPGMLIPMEVDDPEPQDDEVVIQVMPIAVNTSDVIARKKIYPMFPQSCMGLECSGIIEKAGKNVKDWEIGNKVCAILSGGGYAEKVVIQQWQLFLVPFEVSFPDAACLPHASCVVWSELFMQRRLSPFFWLPDDGKKARLSAGQTLLVHEDCNGTSNFAIQIAKRFNVTVIATYRSDGFRKHCDSVGVAECMSQDAFLNGALTQRVDVILNTLGPEHYHKSLSNLKRDGIMISTTTCCSDTIDFAAYRRVIQAASLLYRSKEERKLIVSEVTNNIWPLVTSFELFVHQEYPFSKVVDAHRLMEAEGCGKIILVTDAYCAQTDGIVP
ncbi:hypothetical protein ACLB2K_024356 [Fragaria x ananassa]